MEIRLKLDAVHFKYLLLRIGFIGNGSKIPYPSGSSHYKIILSGVEMEAMDLAFPLLRKIVSTSDIEVAFKDATAVLFLDEVSFQNEKGQTDSRFVPS